MASSRAPVIAVSLAALAVIGAAPPIPCRASVAFPCRISISSLCRKSIVPPCRTSAASRCRISTGSLHSLRKSRLQLQIPDPVVRAALKDIQLSQQENTAALVSLTQGSATQQADLKRISRQLSLLTAQVDTLQNPATPLTTSSIPYSNPRARVVPPSLQTAQADTLQDPMTPSTTSSIPPSNSRARVVRASRKYFSCSCSCFPEACRPCFGRRRPAKSCAGIWLWRKLAVPDITRTTLPLSPISNLGSKHASGGKVEMLAFGPKADIWVATCNLPTNNGGLRRPPSGWAIPP